MQRRTPNEKKKLSLKKDRRNVWDGSKHGSRRIIPLRKKLRNRANRHQQDSNLRTAPRQINEDEADRIESSMLRKAPKRWKKCPDARLSEVIANKQLRRVQSIGRKTRWRARETLFCGECPTCHSDVYFMMEHDRAFCVVGKGVPNPRFWAAHIHPKKPSELPEVVRRLYSLCMSSGDTALGEWVCHLFGVSTCPKCGQLFDVAAVVRALDGLRRIYLSRGTATDHPDV